MQVNKINEQITEYTLTHKGYTLKVLNIGAVITEYSLDGHNIVLNFKDYNDYLTNSMYLGAIVGRTAGRIKDGKFGEHQLKKNFLDKHNLHGNDIHINEYQVQEIENGIKLTMTDPECEYPGNILIEVIYELSDSGLKQTIKASSDKPTLLNLTNHSYFNLDLGQPITDLNFKVDSDYVWLLDDESLPLEKVNTTNTPFDFKQLKPIKDNLGLELKQFDTTRFIDNPFILNGDVTLSSETHKLVVKTNQEALVCYTGNYIDDEPYTFGNSDKFRHAAICLETQKVPGNTDMVTEFVSVTEFNLSRV